MWGGREYGDTLIRGVRNRAFEQETAHLMLPPQHFATIITAGQPASMATATYFLDIPHFVQQRVSAASKKKPHTPFAYDAASSNFDISQLIAMDSDDFMMKHHAAGQQEIELRTRPQTGRTIHVTGSRDFSAAMKALDVSTKRNRIKSLWHGQKFHERPGMRRKRLRRERSIKRYKEGFVATVRRVQELTNQGW
ncbi:hypothetical protein K4K61_012349 [Colletotrichum sp. SAR11_59]|nr:hypothetical protein K4K61_012349 [Colletotrichum sp. SAR11_59]